MLSPSDIQRFLDSAPIDEEHFLKSENANAGVLFTNVNNFKLLLALLAGSGLFDAEAEFLMKSPLYRTVQDSIIIPFESAREIRRIAGFLKDSLVALKHVIPRVFPVESGECVYIKFPSSGSVEEVTNDLQIIEKATMQLFTLPGIEGVFRITYWETGSLKIRVFVQTAAAVSILASVAWSAAVVAKKWMEFKIVYEHVRGLSIKNDSLEDIRAANQRMLEELVSSEARALREKYFNNVADPELERRIGFSINTFSELIRRGGEVNPALSAPEEVGNLFPKYPELFTIQTQIKQLANKE